MVEQKEEILVKETSVDKVEHDSDEEREAIMSKRKQKKALKEEKWLEKKELIRQKRKEAKKGKAKPKAAYAHITRFNGPRDENEPDKNNRSKKEKQQMFMDLCL